MRSSPASRGRSSPTPLTGDLTFYANGTFETEWDAVASFRGRQRGRRHALRAPEARAARASSRRTSATPSSAARRGHRADDRGRADASASSTPACARPARGARSAVTVTGARPSSATIDLGGVELVEQRGARRGRATCARKSRRTCMSSPVSTRFSPMPWCDSVASRWMAQGLPRIAALLLEPAGVGDDEAGAGQDRQEARVGLLVHQPEAVAEQVAQPELLDPVALGVAGRHDERHGAAGLVQHLEGLGEDRAVAQHLEPVQGHEAELRRAARWPGRRRRSPAAARRSTVLAPVSTIDPRARSRRRLVDLALGRARSAAVAILRHDAAVELLGHRVPDVAGAHAGLDVRDLGAQEASDQGAEDGGEGVAVHDHERSGRAPAQPPAQLAGDGARRDSRMRSAHPGTCATRTTSRWRRDGTR